MSTIRKGDWMQTYTGIQFWPLDPKPDEIHIADIAHSLSLQCRFAGHCEFFYSVAQHSLLVSQIVPRRFALWGLLHDASEAYLVDLPRPVKRHSVLGKHYRSVESRLMVAIAYRFHLVLPIPDCVAKADDRILMTEKRDIMGPHPSKWSELARPIKQRIERQTSLEAELKFMNRFQELTYR